MTASYQVRLKGQTGNYVALFDNWYSLNFTHVTNEVGICRFEINGDDDRRALFALDGQIEVWRRDQDASLDWYVEWEGFVRTRLTNVLDNGEKRFIVYSVKYLNLISRRIISYYADTQYTSKSGAAETVIKEFVEENAGPSATTPPRVLSTGVTPGLTVEADAGAGGAWTGNRAWKSLLEVIREIAQSKGVDFDVVGTGAAKFQFRVYPNQRGVDRTYVNVVDGLNGAGNTPVVFSLGRGNMQNPELSLRRSDEVTAVLVLGQGQFDERTVVLRTGGTIGDSPWNRIEEARNATQETFLFALQAIGDNILTEKQPVEQFTFKIIQQESLAYGKHYSWGDLVTAMFDGVQYDKKIVGVNITVADQGDEVPEQITYTLADISGL